MTISGLYRHYKGGLYRVLFVALESTNGRSRERLVVYVSLDEGVLNVRREQEFHEWVDGKGMVKRFTWHGDAE